jgi:signal transduction histidine kinase/DNA-binding NarL/FixJ family response regulator
MVWLEMEVGPVYVQGSILTGISFLCRDISQRVAKEKDLLAAKEAALSDAKAKTAFLSSMSHEIRTPMHAIIGLTELLLQKQQEENTLENLKAIRFSANNLLTIINDILDFSKIEAGRFSFDIHVFDIFQVLDEINKGIRMSAQQKNLGYEVQLNGSIPTHLKGDSVRLSQILMNLLGNSIKFTQTGKIRLSVDVLHDTETEIVLEFTVADTGIGIPRDQLPHIFQTFNQVNNQQRFKIQGTGLGLSITRKLVEMQEGQIKVESEVGKGSVFTFSLPFLKAGQSDWMKSESEENQDPLFKDFKVLLVEDNKINQLLAKQMLTAWGVEVEVAGDGFEAIARLRRHSFDLILLDLQLPEMDGFEVARFVRKSTKSPSNSVPIVALSADVFDETRMLTEEAGMDDYITKPYQQKDILRVLKKFTTGEVEPLVKSEENTVGKTFKSIDIQFVKDKFGKDPETLQYILEIFRDEVGPQLQAVHSLLQKNDIQNSEKPVHKLVSTFFAMGMPETASILSSMEKMLKQGEEAAMVLIRLEEVMGHYQGALMQTGPLLESLTKDPLEAQMKPNNK